MYYLYGMENTNYETEYILFTAWWERLTENSKGAWTTLERLAALEAWMAAKGVTK